MSPVSNQRVVPIPPCYRLPATARREHASPTTRKDFPIAFREARPVAAAAGIRKTAPLRRDDAAPSPASVWGTAFALMLIAQLASPAVGALPQRVPGNDVLGNEPDANEGFASGQMHDPTEHGAMSDPAVEVRPLEHSAIKSEYTLPEALRSVGTAREPFRHLGESVAEVFAIYNGHEMDADVLRQLRSSAGVVDFATGLIPEVQVLRLPSEIASVAADSLDGKMPSTETISGLVQSADPRSLGSPFGPRVRRPPARVKSDTPTPGQNTAAQRRLHPVPRALMAAQRPPPPKQVSAPDIQSLDATHIADVAPALIQSDPVPATSLHIEGETEHLRGYEQALAPDLLPSGQHPRLVLADGRRYIGGDAGYYRATRGRSDDHWLIEAPRQDKAEVPVTRDAVTGQWQAHAPLRLCGGGCGSSKGLSPDSIAGRYSDIEQAVGHLRDEKTQMAILKAMGELGDLHLMRTNRRDRHGIGDNSIVDHRRALREAMKHIDRYAPLVEQQRQASAVTAKHYFWNHYGEAFCQENAEILFHRLIQGGVPESRMRMVTVTPHRRSSHVLVLYTEAHDFTALLDLTTPQPPVINHRDGISGVTFGEFVYMNRGVTVLLDPWSSTKAIEFSRAGNELDVVRKLDDALEEIGHRSGEPYTVSITRPFGTRIFGARQRSISSLGSSNSPSTMEMPRRVMATHGSVDSHPETFNQPESEALDSRQLSSGNDAGTTS